MFWPSQSNFFLHPPKEGVTPIAFVRGTFSDSWITPAGPGVLQLSRRRSYTLPNTDDARSPAIHSTTNGTEQPATSSDRDRSPYCASTGHDSDLYRFGRNDLAARS